MGSINTVSPPSAWSCPSSICGQILESDAENYELFKRIVDDVFVVKHLDHRRKGNDIQDDLQNQANKPKSNIKRPLYALRKICLDVVTDLAFLENEIRVTRELR